MGRKSKEFQRVQAVLTKLESSQILYDSAVAQVNVICAHNTLYIQAIRNFIELLKVESQEDKTSKKGLTVIFLKEILQNLDDSGYQL